MRRTRVFKIDFQGFAEPLIAQAAEVLRAGGLVAFPTETVYGLGANALDADAVKGIFAAKERPAYDPLIVHLAEAAELPQVTVGIPPVAWTLAAHFWPGPLTLVLPRRTEVPPEVTAGGETVAVRVPLHPVAQALIRAAGVPVAAPSANRFGQLSPTRAEDVLADLEGRIDLVLDGGPTSVGVESTVLSLVTPVPTILRPGGVSREALENVLGFVELFPGPASSGQGALASPGSLLQHYAPRAKLILYRGAPAAMLDVMREEALRLHAKGTRVGLLLAEEDLALFAGLPLILRAAGPAEDLEEVARQLFATLRELDAAEVRVILARDFGSAGLGLAIRDRLTRAAGGHVVAVQS
ncbi:MAG: threonylcarbamoyl-AMP synthase [Anaerolineae bacterium]|nr:threonylcarbamoyl-AMP synthase [Anaerolineae bacterium]